MLDGDSDEAVQVSGSAYKIIQHRAYHHGTMLISSSLAELGKSLKSSSVSCSFTSTSAEYGDSPTSRPRVSRPFHRR